MLLVSESGANDDGDRIPEEPIVPHEVKLSKMCDGNLDANDVCEVAGGIIKLTKSAEYINENIRSLVLKETKIECIDKNGHYCDVTFKMANVWKNTAGGCC